MKYTLVVAFALCACVYCCAQDLPGKRVDGSVLLPNGWGLSPVGESLPCGQFPINMRLSPDNRYIAFMDVGIASVSVGLYSTETGYVLSMLHLPNGWFGLTWASTSRLFASGGNAGCIYEIDVVNDSLVLRDSIPIRDGSRRMCVAGIDAGMNRDSNYLYVTVNTDSALFIVDATTRTVVKRVSIGGIGYEPLRSKRYPYVYVSEWDGEVVDIIDIDSMKSIKQVPVGYHPGALVEDVKHERLFAACPGDNVVAIINIPPLICRQRLSTSPFETKMPGSIPTALTLSPKGDRLYICNAGNNAIVAFNVGNPEKMNVMGWIPSGYYPSSIAVTNKTLYILNAKGSAMLDSSATTKPEDECILYRGTLESIPVPSLQDFKGYTQEVLHNTPYFSRRVNQSCGNIVVPDTGGTPSPIKYIFYIVKGQTTYDQILGDMKEGNGDSALCEYPENVTPNQHALAREFALCDNFYADGDAEADGQNWAMGGYCPDFVEKMIPVYYGNHGEPWQFTGQSSLTFPKVGFLWDYCDWKNKKIRVYGEFTEPYRDSLSAAPKSIETHLFGMLAQSYPSDTASVSDSARLRKWLREFEVFEVHDYITSVTVLSLPDDRISIGTGDKNSQRDCVADNDAALGKIVEAITHSRFWDKAVIFVVERAGKSGADHVDPHRTAVQVISPYTKRHSVDHTMYSTASVLKTIEHITGLPAMSQFDESAQLMCNAFTETPVMTPYMALKPCTSMSCGVPADIHDGSNEVKLHSIK